MYQIVLVLILTVAGVYYGAIITDSTVEIVEHYGYPIEEYEDIRTKDNYLLTVHRIPYGLTNTARENRPVVFLMHGLLSSSTDWTNMGPGVSIVYDLVEAGFDVWMGNARGTKWSRKHAYLDPIFNNRRFWNFSWHEIGMYDLPAMINFALKKTNQEKLFYIGHSQGTTTFFVLMSKKPRYNKKIILMVAMAPVVFMSNMWNPFMRLLSKFQDPLKWAITLFGWYEFLPGDELFNMIGQKVCTSTAIMQSMCVSGFFMVCGWDSQQLNRSAIPMIIANVPAGAASKQFIHYAQGINTGEFRQFDHGLGNLFRYGSAYPPRYKLKNVTAPVALVYANNDWLSSPKDVKRLAKRLPNVVDMYEIPFKKFNHLDYVYAIDLKVLLNDYVVELLQNYTNSSMVSLFNVK